MRPKVTVVIPFYNCRYIAHALESVLQQTYRPIEIIVVDDGSNEHVELLQPYKTHIRYIRKSNGGTATALNAGIQAASGDYIAWLSSDDVFYKDKVAKQLDFMLANQAVFSFTDYDVLYQQTGQIQHRVMPQFTSTVDVARSFIDECRINGCTVMLHKQMLQQTGLFDESMPYAHDYDFWVRILLSGIRPYFLKESLTLYRWHPEMGSIKYNAQQMNEFAQAKQKYRDPLFHYIQNCRIP